MEWLDRANRLSKALKDRESFISEHESEMYDSLWEELSRHVEDARATFPQLFTNGQPHSRTIALPVPPVLPMLESVPRKVVVTLSRPEHQITARIIHPGGFEKSMEITFDIDQRRDGVLCLRRGDSELPNMKEAAIHILWPFLYPELPQYDGPESKPQAFDSLPFGNSASRFSEPQM